MNKVKKIGLITAIIATVAIAVGIFYACQKDLLTNGGSIKSHKSSQFYDQELLKKFMEESLVKEFQEQIKSFELKVDNGILHFHDDIDALKLYETLIEYSDEWNRIVAENSKYEEYSKSEKFPDAPMLYAFEVITGFYSLRASIENQMLKLEEEGFSLEGNDPDDHVIVSPYMRTLLTPNCELAIALHIYIIGDEYTIAIADLNTDNLRKAQELILSLGEEKGMIEACLKGYANQVDEDKEHKLVSCCKGFSIDEYPYKGSNGCYNKFRLMLNKSYSSDCGSIVKYQWMLEDGERTTYYFSAEPIHTFNVAGKRSVQVDITFSNGSTCSVSKEIEVENCQASFTNVRRKDKHTFDFEGSEITTCDGSKAEKWIWDFGDGTIDSTSGKKVTHVYQVDGNFDVKLTVRYKSGCIAVYKKTVTSKKTGECCKLIDSEKTKDIYYGNNNDRRIKHLFSVKNVLFWNRIIVRSVHYKKNKKGKWNKEKADKLSVNFEGIIFDTDCDVQTSVLGSEKIVKKSHTVLYDQGMKKPFRVRKHSIWSIYQAEDNGFSIGKNKGIYLHDKNCPK